MAKELEREGVYYYDLYPTEEDLMGETIEHADLVHYLREVLRWLFQGQRCGVYDNLNFYQTSQYKEHPLAPDIAIIKGVSVRSGRSWQVGKTGPAPQVVFEIASKETWHNDLKEKPLKYAQMGVKEYFAYDPNEPPLSTTTSRRLWGWQLDKERGQMQEMVVGLGERLWSPHLESYLVPDGAYLRLYDTHWQQRLTQAEAEARRAEMEAEARQAAQRQAEAAQRWAEMEAETRRAAQKQAEAEARRAEMETEARQAAQRQAEAEARRAEMETEARQAAQRQAEAEARRAEMLAEKLRSLGIDPNLP